MLERTRIRDVGKSYLTPQHICTTRTQNVIYGIYVYHIFACEFFGKDGREEECICYTIVVIVVDRRNFKYGDISTFTSAINNLMFVCSIFCCSTMDASSVLVLVVGNGTNICTNVTSGVASVVVNVGDSACFATNVTSAITSMIVNVTGNFANKSANVTSAVASVVVNVRCFTHKGTSCKVTGGITIVIELVIVRFNFATIYAYAVLVIVSGRFGCLCLGFTTSALIGSNTINGARSLLGFGSLTPLVLHFIELLVTYCANVPVLFAVMADLITRRMGIGGSNGFGLFVSTNTLIDNLAATQAGSAFYKRSLIKLVRNLVFVTLAFLALIPVVLFIMLPFAVAVIVFLNGNYFTLGVGISFAIKCVADSVVDSTLFFLVAVYFINLCDNNFGYGLFLIMAACILTADADCCRGVIICPIPCSNIFVTNRILKSIVVRIGTT